MSGRFTYSDLKQEVDRLNKQHKLSDKTAIKFDVDQAYGGNKVVLRGNFNSKYNYSGLSSITYGYQTPKEAAFDLYQRSSKGLKNEIKRAKEWAMSSYNRNLKDNKD